MSAVHVVDQSATTLLVKFTALKHSTIVDNGDIVAVWPTLSSGEKLLWQVLEAVNGAGVAPSDDDLRAGLDELNLHYAMCALRREATA